MSGYDQVTGQLDNGGTFRATRYTVELHDSAGQLLETYDTAGVDAVRRDGRIVTLVRRDGEAVTIVAASIDDAGRLADMVHSALPPPPPPAPVAGPRLTADQRVDVRGPRGGSQSGCMLAILALVLIALLIGAGYVAYEQGWIDFNDDSASPTASPAPDATHTPEPTATQVAEPTATPDATAAPDDEPTPTP